MSHQVAQRTNAELLQRTRTSRAHELNPRDRLVKRQRCLYAIDGQEVLFQQAIGEARRGACSPSEFRSERKCPVGISAERGLSERLSMPRVSPPGE